MNIYDFINSSDIREYLQKIDYQFTPTEAAWVIYNCRRLDVTMQDKHSSWDQIIRTMPDEDIPKRFNCAGFPSLHKFLMEYMAVEDRLSERFFDHNDAVYFLRSYSRHYREWYNDWDRAFPAFDAAWADAEGDFTADNDITAVQVKRQVLSNPDEYMIFTFDTQQRVLTIDAGTTLLPKPDETVYLESFDGMWFAIPHPFHKGDIVCESDSDGRCHSAESGLCDGPFVLLGTSADNPSPRTIANGDNSDMNGYGYFQNEDGSLYYEVMWNYLNLEHYRGELTGRRRILTAMSNYLKDEIGHDILVRAYHYIMMEEYLNSIRITDITDEGMKLAGLR